jgi:hypothetical protein
MKSKQTHTAFAHIFNRYRLHAGFETLVQFGEALSHEGFVYEDSIFSRWKNGSRVPHERKVILAIITVFIKNNALKTKKEANYFLELLNQRDLSKEEESTLFAYRMPAQKEMIIKDVRLNHLLNVSSIYFSYNAASHDYAYLKN